MSRTAGARGRKPQIYALYDDNETCAFTGNAHECARFLNCDKNRIYVAIRTRERINRKFKVYKIFEEEMK